MVRKFAFHMILAGHRFSKAGQVSISFPHRQYAQYLVLAVKNMLNVSLVWKRCMASDTFVLVRRIQLCDLLKMTSALISITFCFCI